MKMRKKDEKTNNIQQNTTQKMKNVWFVWFRKVTSNGWICSYHFFLAKMFKDNTLINNQHIFIYVDYRPLPLDGQCNNNASECFD